MKVSFAIYMMNIIALVGWSVFWIVAGVGLCAFFIDEIMAWKTRPRRLSDDKLEAKKRELLSHVNRLREKGKNLELIRKKAL